MIYPDQQWLVTIIEVGILKCHLSPMKKIHLKLPATPKTLGNRLTDHQGFQASDRRLTGNRVHKQYDNTRIPQPARNPTERTSMDLENLVSPSKSLILWEQHLLQAFVLAVAAAVSYFLSPSTHGLFLNPSSAGSRQRGSVASAALHCFWDQVIVLYADLHLPSGRPSCSTNSHLRPQI